MFGLPLAFAAPAVLAALVGLVGLYFLLRVTPPSSPSSDIPAAAASHRARSERDDAGAHALADPGAPARDRGAHHSRHGRAVVEQLRRAFRIGAASGSDRRWICRGAGVGQADRLRAGTRGGGGAVGSNRRDRGPLAGRPGHRAARQIRRRGPVAFAGAGSLRAGPRGGVAGDRALSRPRTEDRHPVDRGRGRARRGERLFDQARIDRPLGRGRDRRQRRARARRR